MKKEMQNVSLGSSHIVYLSVFECLLNLAAAKLEGLLPFHDIEHADWQVAQSEN